MKNLWHNQSIRAGMGLFVWLIPLWLSAQESAKDSVPTKAVMPPSEQLLSTPHPKTLSPNEALPEASLLPPVSLNSLFHYSPDKLIPPYYIDPSPMFRGDYSTSGLYPYRNGAFYGSGRQTTLPGIGQMNEASLGYIYRFNPQWSLQTDVNALKMYMPFATGQSVGVSGTLTYRASERLAFNVFGSYYNGRSYGMNSHSYGGTMKVGMTDRFSMEMGVERRYNPMTGKWETVPILIPSYKFNNGFEFGLDVGGIVYEILRNTVIDNNRMNRWGPTIAPPKNYLPIR